MVVLGVETDLLWVISKQTKKNHGNFMNSPSPNGTFPPIQGSKFEYDFFFSDGDDICFSRRWYGCEWMLKIIAPGKDRG